MGLITEMFLSYDGYQRPDIGDQLRISCVFKDVVRDVYTVEIILVSECVNENDTVLIKVSSITSLAIEGQIKSYKLDAYPSKCNFYSHALH